MQVNAERKTVPEPVSPNETSFLVCDLAVRGRHREEYWCKRDPILDERLLCRAQSFRHTVHLLPGESILELGCGGLHFTRALLRVSHRGNRLLQSHFKPSRQLRGTFCLNRANSGARVSGRARWRLVFSTSNTRIYARSNLIR